MTPTQILPKLLALLALVVGIAAGCSGSTSDGAAPTTTAPATVTAAPDGGAPAPPAEVPADPSEGCGTEPDVAAIGDDRPGDVALTFDADGTERVYRLAVPADYDPDVAAPLVLNLHGAGSNALQASVYGDVPRAATERGMLVAAPEGIDGRWELAGEGADADFLAGLVDDLEGRYCVDRARIHIIGMSLGAWKAAVTACALGERVASIALVTVEVFPGTCAPMPVIAFHGTADVVAPYGEGATVEPPPGGPNQGISGAVDNVAAWADSNGCDLEPETTEIGDDVELRSYVGCDTGEGPGAELYTVIGGGHTWPGSDIAIGEGRATTQTIDATALSLDWFEAHPRPS
ncbi:MAG: hypothetical protein KDA98_10220 [Acidimicrobiales bacterium]|nr:hypothetical protein [Acidimicrobiales bacterium]